MQCDNIEVKAFRLRVKKLIKMLKRQFGEKVKKNIIMSRSKEEKKKEKKEKKERKKKKRNNHLTELT